MKAVAPIRASANTTTELSTGSSWCESSQKRALDVVLAGTMLVFASPVMLAVALLVKAGSVGPVLFRQERSGKHGKPFWLLKFRTMRQTPKPVGPSVTRMGDPRVTRIGALLRKWKLDELPQLVNVLKGDLSMVGPRPDIPEYLASLPPGLSRVTDLKPGLTSPATLAFRNEEELLAQAPPDRVVEFYINHILPQKVKMDLAYADTCTAKSDLHVLLQTAKRIVLPHS